MESLKAKEGHCEEAAACSPAGGYIPCNSPAIAIIAWKNRSDIPIRVCAGCLDHNVLNRGAFVIAKLTPPEQEQSAIPDLDNPAGLVGVTSSPVDWTKVKTPPTRKRRAGKYAGIVEHLPRSFGTEDTYQAKINAVKDELRQIDGLTTNGVALAKAFAQLRAEKEGLQEQLSEVELRLKAIEQLLIERYEADDVTSVRTNEGYAVSTHLEPRAQVSDKEAFRVWCVENGYERSLQMWPSTMNSLVKDRLLEGKPEPDGIQVSAYTVVKLMKG